MSLGKVSFVTCVTITALLLAIGFATAGEWVLALVAILLTPAWFFARKYADAWLPFSCLLASVGLAIAGILTGASSVFMILASGFSLAVWDLSLFTAAFGNNSPGKQSRQYEIRHIQSLVLALGFGIFISLLGRLFTLRTPFALLILLIAWLLFGLDRALGAIKKQNVHK